MLPPEDPRAALRRLFRLRTPEVGPPPADLEARLLADHGRRHEPVPGDRSRVGAFVGAHRFAIAGGALALAIGACQIPLEYQRSFGARIECVVASEALAGEAVEGAVDLLRRRLEADNLSLRVLDDGTKTTLEIDAWGRFDDPEAALAAIREAMPALAAVDCETETLVGTVHGTVGGRLGYSLLDLELDHQDADAARARILEELSAQGFTGTAEVEVEDEMGQRRVKIRLEQEHETGALVDEDAEDYEVEVLRPAPGPARVDGVR